MPQVRVYLSMLIVIAAMAGDACLTPHLPVSLRHMLNWETEVEAAAGPAYPLSGLKPATV